MSVPLILLHALRLHEGASRHPGGNYHHVRHLLQALVPQLDQAEMRLLVLVDDCGARDLADVLPASLHFRVGDANDGIVQSDRIVRKAIHELRPALYYRPTGQLPFGKIVCSALMGVADLNFRWLKTPFTKRVYKELSYRWSFRKAHRIICISQFTRNDVRDQFKVPECKLRVIHLGANVLPLPQPLELSVNRFWLTFGHQSHKNVELCLQALVQQGQRLPTDDLVVVGQGAHLDNVLKPMAVALGLRDRVHFVGRISDGELNWLYQNALGLLFVSKFEGFGLPVLEAMQVGCPVIVSDVCSLPEIAGAAALQVPTVGFKTLVTAMNRLTSEPGLAADLIQKGKHRVENFTWDRAAKQSIAIFREVLGSN